MKGRFERGRHSSKGGFTLLEVMVSLILGALMLGGLMGLISVSLQYSQRLKEKSQIQPLLESAAQEILANPQKAISGSLEIGSAPGAPRINILFEKEELQERRGFANRPGGLYRVVLECRGQLLEFSLYVTASEDGKTDVVSD